MTKTFRLSLFALLLICLISRGVFSHSGGVGVVVGDGGFFPDFVEVKVGESVTWVNGGSKEHWPASDFHPVHDAYPGTSIDRCGLQDGFVMLDACRGLVRNESFTFVFDKVGRWGVHDHLSPFQKMTIEVVDSKKGNLLLTFFQNIVNFFGIKKDDTSSKAVTERQEALNLSVTDSALFALNKCTNSLTLRSGSINCYVKEMENISYTYGQKYAFEVLHSLQKMDKVTGGCHFIVHGIGWGSYKRNNSDLHNLLASSDPGCGYGTQMGIIELHVQGLPEGKLLRKDVPDLCGPKPIGNCNHAVGHMLLLEAKGNLSRAIDLCGSLTNSDQNFKCLGGMFMERFVASNLVAHGVVPKSWANWTAFLPQDEKLCRLFKGKYSTVCWKELAHVAFHYFDKNPEAVFAFCNSAPTYEAANICKMQAIPEFMGVSSNLSGLRDICALENLTDSGFEKACYLNVVNIKISNFGRDSSDVIGYCSSMAPDMVYRCFLMVGDSFKRYSVSDDDAKMICANVPDRYMSACLGRP